MNIVINSSHFPITEAIRAYALKKLSKLEKLSPLPEKIHLSLSTQKYSYNAEVTCHHCALDLHAKATSEDLYAAVDAVSDKMLALLKKSKVRHAPQLAHANHRIPPLSEQLAAAQTDDPEKKSL